MPLRVQNRLEGEYGFKLTFKSANALTAKAGPFVEWKDSLTAAVCLGPFCAGAGGELTLLKDEFSATLGAGMTPLPDPAIDPTPDERSIDVSTCFRVANKITVGAGELFLFADYLWCDFWLGVPYNCGQKRAKLVLFDWPGFVWDMEIFKVTEQACCVNVSGDLDCPDDATTVCGP